MQNLYKLIYESLECDPKLINHNTIIEDIEEWDSLGQLAVLSALSNETEGKTDSLDLTNLKSIADLEEILTKNNIIL